MNLWRQRKWKAAVLGILVGVLGISLLDLRQAAPVANAEGGGGRTRHTQVEVNQYRWQVVEDRSGKFLCELVIEYDRAPTDYEMMAACANLFTAAEQAPPAEAATPAPTLVPITPYVFLTTSHPVYIGVSKYTKAVDIPLQEIVVDIRTLDLGMTEPYVILTAYEPEPEYEIVSIRGNINGNEFLCEGSKCRLPIPADSAVEFWAVSSMGDESTHIKTTLRRLNQQDGSIKVAIVQLSKMTVFKDYCSEIWGVSPSQPKAKWAEFPTAPEYLHTDRDYYYLAGELLRKNLVDAADCPSKGLLADGSPNACGLDKAQSEMLKWQNQYDTILWTSGQELGVPPVLLKVLIATESQFWPANVRLNLFEYGLAQVNQWGADVALRWDHKLNQDICTGVLNDCAFPYASLSPTNQSILRGALVRAVNAECPTCKGGVDPVQSIKTVPIIGRVLRANCRQAKFIFDENSTRPSYEDSFKFTLVSYHSGYFCLDDAIHSTISAGLPVTWENVSSKISSGCFGGAEYVNNFWDALTAFPDYVIPPNQSPDAIPFVRMITSPKPTITPTFVEANSKIRVVVYIDKNQNGKMDSGEGVSNLPVQVGLNNGTTFTLQTVDGVIVFDIKGVAANSNATVLLPTQFKSTKIRVPETGELEVVFILSQTIAPPVLP